MVRPFARGNHVRLLNLAGDPVGNQPIIDSPAGIVGLGRANPLGPPGVLASHLPMNQAEGIGKARVQQAAETGPLFIGKAG